MENHPVLDICHLLPLNEITALVLLESPYLPAPYVGVGGDWGTWTNHCVLDDC